MRRRKRHTPEQIIRKLRDADAMPAANRTIGEVCQALEISEQTFYRWRNQYGGMKADEARRLKELEQENARLKRLLAEAEAISLWSRFDQRKSDGVNQFSHAAGLRQQSASPGQVDRGHQDART